MAKARKLDRKDRRMLAQQILTLGHLSAGALVFKQVYSGEEFDMLLTILGVLLLALAYSVASMVLYGGDK